MNFKYDVSFLFSPTHAQLLFRYCFQSHPKEQIAKHYIKRGDKNKKLSDKSVKNFTKGTKVCENRKYLIWEFWV